MGSKQLSTDDIRKTKIVELRSQLDEIDASLVALDAKGPLEEADETRWDDLLVQRDTIKPELDKLEERASKIEEIKQTTHREIHGMPEIRKPVEELYGRDVTGLDWRTARDGALRILDDKEQNYPLRSHQLDHLESQVRSNGDIARRTIVTENEHYRSAWFKMMRGENVLSAEENDAVLRFYEYRAQSEGTTTAGGFAIPVFIDPSIILTDQETLNPFLTIARQVEIKTNAWKGVSAAGVSWSFDAEGSAVSDDSLTIAQPSVTAFMARGFIPYSIEIGEDWPGFQAEMARVLANGYDELLIDKFSRGSGSGEPRGILTALAASNPTVIVTSTTDGAFGQEDIYATWAALPQKYQSRASWMMNVDVMNKTRQMGTSNVYHASTVALPAGQIDRLFERPVYQSPYFPVFSSTTGASNRLVVGDFSNYVVARRSGMSVELVPHLVDVTNNRPTGSRGWFAYARIGGNSVNDAAFRLQANT